MSNVKGINIYIYIYIYIYLNEWNKVKWKYKYFSKNKKINQIQKYYIIQMNVYIIYYI